jgi:large subunit ribosomal protein L31
MKEAIHPEYHEINVVMTDGTSFKTRSTMGKAGDTLNLDIDPKTHPAWTGQHRINDSGGQVAKFNKRFQNLGAKAAAAAMATPVGSGPAVSAPSKPKAEKKK